MSEIGQLIAETDVPVIIADQRGVITYVNHLFEKVFDWKRDDLLGQMVAILIPENLRDAHQMGFSRFIVSGKSTILNQKLQLEILTGNGKAILAEHFIIAEKVGLDWTFGAKIEAL